MITLEDLKEYLNITETDADTVLAKGIESAKSSICNFTNRGFEKTEYVEVVEKMRDDILNIFFFVKNYPITELIKIEYLSGTDWVEYTTDTAIDPEYGNKVYCDDLPSGKIKVTYTGGYDTIPAEIKECCIELAAEYYFNSDLGSKRLGVKSKNWNSQAGEGITYSSIRQDVMDKLQPWRVVKI